MSAYNFSHAFEWRGAGGAHTPRSSRLSSLWRGMTVTSSISHRNAISGGVSPGGRGNAMIATRSNVISNCLEGERTADAPEQALPNWR